MTHLLVTNDFPPKVGGIQSYLWELWRRLPPAETVVLTTPSPGDGAFDAGQDFRIERTRASVLLPSRSLTARVERLADEVGAGLVVLDPALPVGLIGPRLSRPYAVVLHGAEAVAPARLPVGRQLVARVLGSASAVVAAGRYTAAAVAHLVPPGVPVTVVMPGVDPRRFRPVTAAERDAARDRLSIPRRCRLVLSVSRLVPRKGMDRLIDAAALLAPTQPDLLVAIAGEGRDRGRLERRIARTSAPVQLLGSVPGERLPALYGCADVFAMVCRSRWWGLEQEGFGVVFLEAAACAVAQVAGDSGGAAEAVADGETGLVVRRPGAAQEVASALGRLLDDPEMAGRFGAAARRRAEDRFGYNSLAAELHVALKAAGG